MTKIKFTPISFVLIPVLSAAILSGCVREKIDVNQGAQDDFVQTDGPGGEEGVVNFRFSTASLVTATRSMAPADETAVTTVDLLEFSGTDNTLLYHYTPKGSGNSWSAKLTSTGGTANRYLFIINASAEVAKILESAASPLTASDFEQQLQFATDAAWDTSAPRYLPMYAEKTVAYTSGSGNNTWNLKLLRSVARIDVGLNFTTAASSNPSAEGNIADGIADFSLTKVSVYNIPQSSLVSPGADIYNKWANSSQPEETKLAAGGQSTTGFASGIEYLAETESSGKWFFRQIYVGEASNHTGSAPKTEDQLACLVVAGQYKGTEGYYRIDLASTSQDGTVTYFDVVRNFRYLVNIKSVNGPGYADAQTAFNSAPKNIEYDITVIEEGDMNDITFDGRYQLAVDRSTLDFFRSPSTSVVSVYADHPSGWTVERAPVSEGGPFDWIELPGDQSGAASVTKELAITVKKFEDYRTEEDKRQGWFYIKSGTLSKKINIVQSAGILLNIEVTPTPLVFRKTAGSPKTITVTVDPVFKDRIQFTTKENIGQVGSNQKIENWTKYMELTGDAVEDPVTGTVTKTFAFQPADRTGTSVQGVLAGLVTIYIQDPDDPSGRIEARTLTVEQLATDIALEVINLREIAAAGETVDLQVKSDVSWWLNRIALEGTPDTQTDQAVATNPGDSSNPHSVGTENLNVKFLPNNSWTKRVFLFYASSSNQEFQSDVPFRVTQNAPVPSLIVDNKTIDFGSGNNATDKQVKITTNAKVVASMTASESDWNYVNSSMSPTRSELKTAMGQETFNTTYVFRENNGLVTFHPRNYSGDDLSSASPKPDAAGTRHSVDITFSTSAAGQGVQNASQTVTLSRTTPAFFHGLQLPTAAVSASGGNVTVKGKTNAAWIAESGSAKTSLQQAQAYASREAQLNIPALADNASNYGTNAGETVNTQVNVRYGLPGAVSNASGGTTIQGTVPQKKYYVAAPNLTWNTSLLGTSKDGTMFSGPSGGSVDLKFPADVELPGNKAKVRLTLKTAGTEVLAPQEIDVKQGGRLSFGAHNVWGTRTLCVEWYNPRTSSWERMTGNTKDQRGRALPAYEWTGEKLAQNTTRVSFKLSEWSNGTGNTGNFNPYIGGDDEFYYEVYAAWVDDRDLDRGALQKIREVKIEPHEVQNSQTISINVGRALYSRALTIKLYLRNGQGYTSQNIATTNEYRSRKLQPSNGNMICTLNGKHFVVAPTDVEVSSYSDETWYSAVGVTPSRIWQFTSSGKIDNRNAKEISNTTDFCQRRYSNINDTDKVRGLQWRVPTREEMVKVIELENSRNSNHNGGSDIIVDGDLYLCTHRDQTSKIAYLTTHFTSYHKNGWYVGGYNTNEYLLVAPHYVVHKSNPANVTGGGYAYDEQALVGQKTSDAAAENLKRIPVPTGYDKVYVRCIAYLD